MDDERTRRRPPITAALLAVGVVLVWSAFAATTAVFLVWIWPAVVGVFLGLILAFLVWFSRPHLAKRPVGSAVARDEAPEFFRLADEVAGAVGSRPISVLLLDGEPNASTVRAGVRRTLVVSIGLPLWEALTPDERVALIAHELAHDVNDDPWRSVLIGSSIRTLEHWHDFARPGTKQEAKEEGLLAQFTWGGQWLAAFLIEAVLRLQVRLTGPSHRDAELRADRLAAAAAGTAAMVALLDRTIFVSSIRFAVRRAARDGDDLWESIRRRFDELPEADRATIRTAAVVDEVTTDPNHPPTHERIKSLNDAPRLSVRVHLDRGWSERIDREFEPARARVADELRAAQQSGY